MNLVHTFEFTVISILYLFTIIQTMSLIGSLIIVHIDH